MIRDPTRKEMQAVLRAVGIYDCWAGEEAIYWFATDYHSGRGSNLYNVLCMSPYEPGPITRGPETPEGYNPLRKEFA